MIPILVKDDGVRSGTVRPRLVMAGYRTRGTEVTGLNNTN